MKFIKMRKLFLFIILFLLSFIIHNSAFSQDIHIDCTRIKSCTLTSQRAWSQFNQTFIFTPLQPENSINIFILNRNTTSSHTLNLSVYQTPVINISDRSNNISFWIKDLVNGNCQNISSNSMSYCWVNTLFASQIAITITNAATASGSPDTGDIYILQGTGNPQGQGLGQFFDPLSNFQSSISSGTTFAASSQEVNPIANSPALQFITGNKTAYLDKAIITTTVNATIQLAGISTSGTTCLSVPITNLNFQSILTSTSTITGSCTGAAITSIVTHVLNLSANTPYTLDLRGYYILPNNTKGFMIYSPNAVTGTITANLTWSEE